MTGTPIRRIITGHNNNGRSIILQDQATPHVKTSPHRPGVVINNLWMTGKMPAPTASPEDAAHPDMTLAPGANGINFRIVEFPPEADYIDKISGADAAKAFGDMGAADALAGDADAGSGVKHPFMHKTDTLDFAIIVSGEVYLVLDEEETLMQAGDVCVQRATNHVWSNRSDEPCRIAFVLIDGES